MEWPYRLAGLVVLLVMVFSALVYGAEQLAAMTDDQAQSDSDSQYTKRAATVSRDEPAQLAFTEGGFTVGTHRIKPEVLEPIDDEDVEDDDDVEDQDDDVNGSGDDQTNDDAEDRDEAVPGLNAGLYTTTFEAENCSYRLINGEGDIPFDYLYEPDPYDAEEYNGSRVRRNDQQVRVIGEDHLHQGRMLVTINGIEPDTFTSSNGCGSWIPWSPLQTPLTKAGDGDYWVGDLVQGEWTVPPGCIWEKVAAFRGGRLDDVIHSDLGPGSVMIDEGTLGLRIRQCQGQSLVRIGDAPPYVPYVHPGVGQEVDVNGRPVRDDR